MYCFGYCTLISFFYGAYQTFNRVGRVRLELKALNRRFRLLSLSHQNEQCDKAPPSLANGSRLMSGEIAISAIDLTRLLDCQWVRLLPTLPPWRHARPALALKYIDRCTRPTGPIGKLGAERRCSPDRPAAHYTRYAAYTGGDRPLIKAQPFAS